MKNNFVKVAIVVGVILLIPLFGNLFVEGWNWDLSDFVIMGTLLFLTSLAIAFVSRRFINPLHKIVVMGFIILASLLIWVELAVDGVSQLVKVIL